MVPEQQEERPSGTNMDVFQALGAMEQANQHRRTQATGRLDGLEDKLSDHD